MKAYKLPSGKYRVQVLLGHDEEGKRIMKSISANTEWEALKLASELTDRPPEFNIDKMTVMDALGSYIESRRNILSASTIYGYECCAKNRLRTLHNIPITQIRRVDIQYAINEDAARGLGYKSLKSAFDLVRAALALFDVNIPSSSRFRFPRRKHRKVNCRI